MDNYRLQTLLQVFTIILVFKGISATYFVTKYALQNQLSIISYYANLLTIIPIFLLISLILMGLPLIFKIKKKSRRKLDIIAVIIIFVGLIVLFL